MKQITKKRLATAFIIFVVTIGGIVYFINWAFYDIQRIHGQEYITETTSPNGTYTVTASLNNGGATTGCAILGTLKNNKSGKSKNIYWKYHCEKADMQWLDDETIKINGVELKVKNEVYDYRMD